MGSGESRSMEVLKYFEKEWEYIQTSREGVKVFRNRDTDKEAELHSIVIEPKNNLLKEYDIYNYRRVQDRALVSTYAVQNLKDQSPNLCGNRDILKVMTEHIPLRAREIKRLPLRQGLYMLSEAIRGFDDCYSKIGAFQVNDSMIGVNKDGHVKVWLNDNFAMNHPAHERPLLQITSSEIYRNKNQQQETTMLAQLVEVVGSKCSGGFPPDFLEAVSRQSTFVEAYRAVQDYCLQKQIQVPDRIDLQQAETVSCLPQSRSPQSQAREESQKDNFSFKNYGPRENSQPQREDLTREPQLEIRRKDPEFSHHNYGHVVPTMASQPAPAPQLLLDQANPPAHQSVPSNRQMSTMLIREQPNNNFRESLINQLPRDTLVSRKQAEVHSYRPYNSSYPSQASPVEPVFSSQFRQPQVLGESRGSGIPFGSQGVRFNFGSRPPAGRTNFVTSNRF